MAPGVAVLMAHAGMIPPDGNDLDPDLNTVHTLVAVDEGGPLEDLALPVDARRLAPAPRGARGADPGAARPARPSERTGCAVTVSVRVPVPAELLASRRARVVLLDVRWALGDDQGREKYLAGHLPGAVFVDLETELADPPSAAEGRHPLPSLQRLQAAARRWGIRDGDPVVAYDATGGLAAARAWWLLRWGGLTDVRLLDGGLDAWVAAGRCAGDRATSSRSPGDVTLTGGGMPVLSIDEAAALPASGGVLLDARAGERYRGEVEPIDPRAGHVPGRGRARPTADNLAADGRFRSGRRAGRRGSPRSVPCPGRRSGSTAAPASPRRTRSPRWPPPASTPRCGPGSWSQWSADPARPAATGTSPG